MTLVAFAAPPPRAPGGGPGATAPPPPAIASFTCLKRLAKSAAVCPGAACPGAPYPPGATTAAAGAPRPYGWCCAVPDA